VKIIFKNLHAKAQRREGIWISKLQLFFASLRLCVSICLLSFAVAATAQTNNSSNAVPFLGDIPQFHLTTNKLSDAEIQGRNLAKQLADTKPDANTGTFQIHDNTGKTTKISFKIGFIDVFYQRTNAAIFFQAYLTNKSENLLVMNHLDSSWGIYHYFNTDENSASLDPFRREKYNLSEAEMTIPFVGSDFWICDLGLEFFHWPEQKIIKKEFARGRGCMVLESTNPNPSPNGYSRVDSWIDGETLGIVHAEAFDANGKLLKVFDPKSFKKVNGQWELQDMEIRNVQTGSRTRIEFDLKGK
jgi:Outer membrane lipoprotein-sorting protein